MKIATLVKDIKVLDLNNVEELVIVSDLSKAIFNEWLKIKIKYRNKLKTNSSFNEWLHAMYESEQDIIFGLLDLLNQKLIDFFNYKNKYETINKNIEKK
jgi:hypothetical protein